MRIYKGDYVEVEIPVKVEETGAAFDITGYDMTFRAVGASKTIEKKVGEGIELTDPANGIAVLTLLPDDNDTVGIYKFGIRIIKDDKPQTIKVARYEILADETS